MGSQADMYEREVQALKAENAKLRAELQALEDKGKTWICPEDYQAALLQVGELQKALDHATTCPLIQKARSLMGDAPEKITACVGCRDVLLILGRTEKPKSDVECCCQPTGKGEYEHCPGCPKHNDHPAHDDDHPSYAKKRNHDCAKDHPGQDVYHPPAGGNLSQ